MKQFPLSPYHQFSNSSLNSDFYDRYLSHDGHQPLQTPLIGIERTQDLLSLKLPPHGPDDQDSQRFPKEWSFVANEDTKHDDSDDHQSNIPATSLRRNNSTGNSKTQVVGAGVVTNNIKDNTKAVGGERKGSGRQTSVELSTNKDNNNVTSTASSSTLMSSMKQALQQVDISSGFFSRYHRSLSSSSPEILSSSKSSRQSNNSEDAGGSESRAKGRRRGRRQTNGNYSDHGDSDNNNNSNNNNNKDVVDDHDDNSEDIFVESMKHFNPSMKSNVVVSNGDHHHQHHNHHQPDDDDNVVCYDLRSKNSSPHHDQHQHQHHHHHQQQHQQQQQQQNRQSGNSEQSGDTGDNATSLSQQYHGQESCFGLDPSKQRFQYLLAAPISVATKLNEDTMTYLNQGQAYEIKLGNVTDVAEARKGFMCSIINIGFHERHMQQAENELWQQWSQQHPNEKIFSVDMKLSYNVYGVDSDGLNKYEFLWDSSKAAGVFIRINSISTEFTPKKHGGEKGVPFRLSIETFSYNSKTHDSYFISAASCQIKVFKPKGAERKIRSDRDKIYKRPPSEQDKYHRSCDHTTFRECSLTSLHPMADSSLCYYRHSHGHFASKQVSTSAAGGVNGSVGGSTSSSSGGQTHGIHQNGHDHSTPTDGSVGGGGGGGGGHNSDDELDQHAAPVGSQHNNNNNNQQDSETTGNGSSVATNRDEDANSPNVNGHQMQHHHQHQNNHHHHHHHQQVTNNRSAQDNDLDHHHHNHHLNNFKLSDSPAPDHRLSVIPNQYSHHHHLHQNSFDHHHHHQTGNTNHTELNSYGSIAGATMTTRQQMNSNDQLNQLNSQYPAPANHQPASSLHRAGLTTAAAAAAAAAAAVANVPHTFHSMATHPYYGHPLPAALVPSHHHHHHMAPGSSYHGISASSAMSHPAASAGFPLSASHHQHVPSSLQDVKSSIYHRQLIGSGTGASGVGGNGDKQPVFNQQHAAAAAAMTASYGAAAAFKSSAAAAANLGQLAAVNSNYQSYFANQSSTTAAVAAAQAAAADDCQAGSIESGGLAHDNQTTPSAKDQHQHQHQHHQHNPQHQHNQHHQNNSLANNSSSGGGNNICYSSNDNYHHNSNLSRQRSASTSLPSAAVPAATATAAATSTAINNHCQNPYARHHLDNYFTSSSSVNTQQAGSNETLSPNNTQNNNSIIQNHKQWSNSTQQNNNNNSNDMTTNNCNSHPQAYSTTTTTDCGNIQTSESPSSCCSRYKPVLQSYTMSQSHAIMNNESGVSDVRCHLSASQNSSNSSATHITINSNCMDVVSWFASNRFGALAKTFNNFSGADLLRLSKTELIEICGLIEGIRLYNSLHNQPIKPRRVLYICIESDDIYHPIYLYDLTLDELLSEISLILESNSSEIEDNNNDDNDETLVEQQQHQQQNCVPQTIHSHQQHTGKTNQSNNSSSGSSSSTDSRSSSRPLSAEMNDDDAIYENEQQYFEEEIHSGGGSCSNQHDDNTHNNKSTLDSSNSNNNSMLEQQRMTTRAVSHQIDRLLVDGVASVKIAATEKVVQMLENESAWTLSVQTRLSGSMEACITACRSHNKRHCK